MAGLKTAVIAALLLVVAVSAVEKKTDHLPADCGRFISFKYFIGNKTDIDDFPWVVLLEYETPRGRLVACGGVILSSRYILTAAHCVANLGGNWSLDSVRLGEYDLTTAPDCILEGDAANTTTCMPDTLSVKIEKSIVYEAYNSSVRGYDIALLRLAEDIKFTDFVKPICLPKRTPQPQKFHAAGWGRLANHAGSDLKLRSYVSLVNGSECRTAYSKENVGLTEDQLCAGNKAKEDACIGDSGGPMMGVEKMADGKYRMAVFGLLTTDGRFCNVGGWPGIYTDVLKYRDWVIEHTK